MCLIGKTQLLCMQCRGIGPHLVARGKSHWFSRVAEGIPILYKLQVPNMMIHNFKDYTAFIIIKYWQHSVFCTICSYSLDHA